MSRPSKDKETPDYLIVYGTKKLGQGQDAREVKTRIGALFPHKQGQGFGLSMDYVPVNPDIRMVVFPPYEEDEEQATEARQARSRRA